MTDPVWLNEADTWVEYIIYKHYESAANNDAIKAALEGDAVHKSDTECFNEAIKTARNSFSTEYVNEFNLYDNKQQPRISRINNIFNKILNEVHFSKPIERPLLDASSGLKLTDIKEVFTSARDYTHPFNYKKHIIDGNGLCYFNSIAFILSKTGLIDKYPSLPTALQYIGFMTAMYTTCNNKQLIVNEHNPDHVAIYIAKFIKNGISHDMRFDWGEYCSIESITTMLKSSISLPMFVYNNPNNESYWIDFNNFNMSDEIQYFLYLSNKHYDVGEMNRAQINGVKEAAANNAAANDAEDTKTTNEDATNAANNAAANDAEDTKTTNDVEEDKEAAAKEAARVKAAKEAEEDKVAAAKEDARIKEAARVKAAREAEAKEAVRVKAVEAKAAKEAEEASSGVSGDKTQHKDVEKRHANNIPIIAPVVGGVALLGVMVALLYK